MHVKTCRPTPHNALMQISFSRIFVPWSMHLLTCMFCCESCNPQIKKVPLKFTILSYGNKSICKSYCILYFAFVSYACPLWPFTIMLIAGISIISVNTNECFHYCTHIVFFIVVNYNYKCYSNKIIGLHYNTAFLCYSVQYLFRCTVYVSCKQSICQHKISYFACTF